MIEMCPQASSAIIEAIICCISHHMLIYAYGEINP